MLKKCFCLFLGLVCLFACLTVCGCKASDGETPTETESESESATEVQTEEQSNEVQVVVLLGQSNAEGHTWHEYLNQSVGVTKTKRYIAGFRDVLICYENSMGHNSSNGEFVPVKIGQGYEQTRMGPEVGMAEVLSDAHLKTPVYIIKYAYGGTSLSHGWCSPSSGSTGELYAGAVDYILAQCEKLENMGLRPVIKAICWMQGETDATGEYFDRYEELERLFVTDLRQDLSGYSEPEQEIGFVDAGISECTLWKQYKVINSAKQALAEEDDRHTYIDTIAAGLKFNREPSGSIDISHYDSASELLLGQLFGEVLLAEYLQVN